MKRICFAGLVALFLLFSVVHAQSFEVQEISQDGAGAVLLDRDTGTEWIVVVGDEIEGWEIIEIDESGVSIKKEPEGDMPFAIVHKLEKMSKHGFSFEP